MHPPRRHRVFKPIRHARFTRFFCLLFFVSVLCATAAAQEEEAQPPATVTTAQEDTKEEAKASARSVIRGRVVYEDNNRPVRRASIMLLNVDGSGGADKKGVTNERGEFRLNGIAAGSYFVAVESPGIVTPFSYVEIDEKMDERNALAQIRTEFEPVTVNGTNSVEVQIKARRGGVISGRVTYSDGDPATNVQISLLRKKDGRFARFILNINPASFATFRTDDRGMYRIAGIPPGEYVVGASELNTRPDTRDEYGALRNIIGGDALTTSYYQNQTSPRAANVLKIEAGQEANGVDVTILDRALYTVSGTVVARQGRRPVRARLSIQAKTESLSSIPFFDSGPTAQTDEQGRWSFTDVPDGAYLITIQPANDSGTTVTTTTVTTTTSNDDESSPPPQSPQRTEPPRPLPLARRQQEVTVSGADLSNVVIELSEGGRVQGTVVVEGSKVSPVEGGNLMLSPVDGNYGVEKYGYIQQDGAFTIDEIPPGEFSLRYADAGGKYYIKAMTAGSTDLLRDTLKIGPGTHIQNVRITIAGDIAQLTGRVVSSEDRKPARGAVVLLVPADPSRWRFLTGYLFGVADSDGAFSVTAAPGPYLVMTLTPGERLSVNEAFVRARSASARQVSLQPNGRETIELIAPAAGPR